MFPAHSKILIVDDMSMFRQMVKEALTMLELKNYSEAPDGRAAWTAIVEAYDRNEPYHLIISDWEMPKMNGIELLKTVRGTSWSAGLPFILLTSVSEKQNIIEAVQADVTQYIVKPFSAQVLRTKMEQAYAKAKSLGDQWVPN